MIYDGQQVLHVTTMPKPWFALGFRADTYLTGRNTVLLRTIGCCILVFNFLLLVRFVSAAKYHAMYLRFFLVDVSMCLLTRFPILMVVSMCLFKKLLLTQPHSAVRTGTRNPVLVWLMRPTILAQSLGFLPSLDHLFSLQSCFLSIGMLITDSFDTDAMLDASFLMLACYTRQFCKLILFLLH